LQDYSNNQNQVSNCINIIAQQRKRFMIITFLGTGTSQGVPIIACNCDVCKSNNPKDKRLRSSIFIQDADLNVVIDTGPDFRTQLLRENIEDLNAVLFTHEHKDHTAGFDDVRAFNFKYNGKAVPIYLTERVEEALRRDFHYIFSNESYPGIPIVAFNRIGEKPFKIKHLEFIPIQLLHYKLPVLGFRIHNFCYITDANQIENAELEKMKGLDVLVLNALRLEKHLSHFTLQEALDIVAYLKPKQTYLTHISHQLGKHDEVEKILPKNVNLAFDGLKIDVYSSLPTII
jgi:phosphoribosyl 1,2-cyclic phosphate phosphodiesterase